MSKTCSVRDCIRPILAKEMCNAHYIRNRNHKNINLPIRIVGKNRICKVQNCHKKHYSSEYCKTHFSTYKRIQHKTILINLLGNKCNCCNREFPIEVYDFHHKDESQKEFDIGQKLGIFSLEKLIAEATKCELLCANCHRLTYSTYDRLS